MIVPTAAISRTKGPGNVVRPERANRDHFRFAGNYNKVSTHMVFANRISTAITP